MNVYSLIPFISYYKQNRLPDTTVSAIICELKVVSRFFLYTREITVPPLRLIKGRKPVFGTFAGAPRLLDIRGVESPFGGVPLPRIITNFRIKSSLVFTFTIGQYIGTVDFFDAKMFGYAEVVFWNTETSRKFAYRAFMGLRRRLIPHELDAGFCASFHKTRYIRISWDKKRNRVSLIMNLKGDGARPGVQAAFIAHYSDSGEIMSVTPSPTKSRCSASYVLNSTIHGAISLEKTQRSDAVPMHDSDGQSLLIINRAYYAFVTEREYITSCGMVDNKNISLRLASTDDDAVDPYTYNDNILFVDGKCTPLPPVCITHPFGLTGQNHSWVIQDTENMVDLTFTPVSDNMRIMSFFLVRTNYHTIYGTLEGNLKTKDGETLSLHGLPCIAKNQLLRM